MGLSRPASLSLSLVDRVPAGRPGPTTPVDRWNDDDNDYLTAWSFSTPPARRGARGTRPATGHQQMLPCCVMPTSPPPHVQGKGEKNLGLTARACAGSVCPTEVDYVFFPVVP